MNAVLLCGPAVIIDTAIARITIINSLSSSRGGAGADVSLKKLRLLLNHDNMLVRRRKDRLQNALSFPRLLQAPTMMTGFKTNGTEAEIR